MRAQGELGVFENVTAILRRARVPSGPVPPVDLDALLRARAAGRGGGVCFELAPLFRRLLTGLGYRVWPILAQITFPGSHHATVVDLDGARYLVDVGSGAPCGGRCRSWSRPSSGTPGWASASARTGRAGTSRSA